MVLLPETWQPFLPAAAQVTICPNTALASLAAQATCKGEGQVRKTQAVSQVTFLPSLPGARLGAVNPPSSARAPSAAGDLEPGLPGLQGASEALWTQEGRREGGRKRCMGRCKSLELKWAPPTASIFWLCDLKAT